MTPYGYPSDEYHCLLDEQPHYLVPPALYRDGVPDEPLIVNPSCWFSWHGALPPDMSHRLSAADYLLQSDAIVWVDDPGTRSVWPYWAGPEYQAYLADLAPGWPVTASLPAHARWVLTQANILVDPSYAARRRNEWFRSVMSLSTSFERHYVSVAGLIPPLHVGALRRYFRYKTRSGALRFGDDQVPYRHVAHNEAAARFFHGQLTQAFSDIARTPVKPSYSYLAVYEPGSVLERHTDREQCEYSMTICLDASPEPQAQAPWPIQLDVSDGSLRVWQYIGDALLYRGRYVPHYRDGLPEGYTSTALLLHYVDEHFAGQLA